MKGNNERHEQWRKEPSGHQRHARWGVQDWACLSTKIFNVSITVHNSYPAVFFLSYLVYLLSHYRSYLYHIIFLSVSLSIASILFYYIFSSIRFFSILFCSVLNCSFFYYLFYLSISIYYLFLLSIYLPSYPLSIYLSSIIYYLSSIYPSYYLSIHFSIFLSIILSCLVLSYLIFSDLSR